ncbi:hypothetical protein [Cellulomonas carbonis]|uniref:ScoMcrA-like N-terminal head domain-containing protein n=1 Tax=Cellulomonas carbonis T26 TaxID=947969 RepID=A0A0A0BMQ9_9CELL|nr:hypothetical protein [Cellulomonas carbonis]KGM09221.1 hypothetical protein N868_03755 [Cellulomonas carbonis T26]
MATFSSVTGQHVLQAIAEYDQRGGDAFLDVYGFGPTPGYALVHEGRTYDARALLAVAHRFATGRLATPEEFQSGGMDGVVTILRRRGFMVTEPAVALREAPGRASHTRTATPRATRTTRTTRSTAEVPPPICPTCSMTLPATGICDDCG